MKHSLCLVILVIFTFFKVDLVLAHPGKTASDGCHYCRTNCDKWGYTEDTRHCHGGNIEVVKPTITPVPSVKPIETVKPTYTPAPYTPAPYSPNPTTQPMKIIETPTPVPEIKGDSTVEDEESSDFSFLTFLFLGGIGTYGLSQILKTK